MQQSHIEHPVFVSNDQQLRQLCQQWQHASVLALDTEFIRTDTFYPIAGLIQLSDGDGCFLIDPLAITDFSPLADLFTDEGIVKVLHSCGEDLEVFDRLLGVLPSPLFDTQVGAALAGYGFSLGYQKLVDELLQLHVPKGETRSNWLQRPLTESQVHYAALDVAYLHEIYRRLLARLQLLQRESWWQQECEQLLQKYRSNNPVEHYYQRVKSAWKLSPPQLHCLRALTAWRERRARDKDRPRSRIIKDRACYDLALRQPKTLADLAGIEDLSPGMVRRFGETLLAIIKQAQHGREEQYPAALPKPLPLSATKLMKELKSLVRQRAEHLQLPPELLVKKKDYESLLRSGQRQGQYSLPASLCDWRKDVIGNELLAHMQRSR